MYIIKNALKCIGRSKGRNILIGIIVLVIAISACLGLSIRQAAESAKEETLGTMSVTASISFDRQSMMGNMQRPENGEEFDRSQFKDMMNKSSSLSIEEYIKYSEADSVNDFYYIQTVSLNGTENFEAVTSEEEESESQGGSFFDFGGAGAGSMGPGGMGSGGKQFGRGGMSGDFTVTGYSGDNAMTSFIDGTASITDGKVFEEASKNYDCIISEELATYNSVKVGDTIEVSNPQNEEETYKLNVVGLYLDSTANENSFPSTRGGMTSSDPANRIYMSYEALNSIVSASTAASKTVTDEDTGREYETKLSASLNATYVFEDVDSYYQFEEEVRELGLSEDYTVSSQDLAEYENSMLPLNTLSTMAGWFLIVILVIGAVILIVLNIFNVRERKYEIGVLTAMGMKKFKVALQFLTEIFVVTLAAVIIGASIGAVTSVPVTNALLENQVASQQNKAEEMTQNFGREPGGMKGGMGAGQMGGERPEGAPGGKNPFANMFGSDAENNYVTEISSAMNLTVVFQMLLIAVLLTLVSGAVSMLFVMRYEPLKILANRD